MICFVVLLQTYLKSLKQPDNVYRDIADHVEEYTRECFMLCWLMSIQDPPVVLVHEVSPGEPFNPNAFKSFTKTGASMAYVVWPPMLLCKGGSILCKGVVQCM